VIKGAGTQIVVSNEGRKERVDGAAMGSSEFVLYSNSIGGILYLTYSKTTCLIRIS
jgi:hypothetical protein